MHAMPPSARGIVRNIILASVLLGERKRPGVFSSPDDTLALCARSAGRISACADIPSGRRMGEAIWVEAAFRAGRRVCRCRSYRLLHFHFYSEKGVSTRGAWGRGGCRVICEPVSLVHHRSRAGASRGGFGGLVRGGSTRQCSTMSSMSGLLHDNVVLCLVCLAYRPTSFFVCQMGLVVFGRFTTKDGSIHLLFVAIGAHLFISIFECRGRGRSVVDALRAWRRTPNHCSRRRIPSLSLCVCIRVHVAKFSMRGTS